MTHVVTDPAVISQTAARPRALVRRDAALYAVVGLCHLPLLLVQWHRLWQIECYRYFPFLLAAVILLLGGRWRQLPVRPASLPTRTSLAVLLLGWFVLLAATLLDSPWLGTVAALITVLALLLSFGRSTAARLAPAWALLWLTLPLPFRWDQRLFVWLQGWTCEGGSRLLDFWGFNHVLAGYVLDVPGRQFQVEQLSGEVQWVPALVVLAAVLAVGLRRGWIHGALLVCGGAFWAVTLSMLSAALIVVLAVVRDVDITTGATRHVFDAGYFVAALLLLLSTDRLLRFLSEPSGFSTAGYEEDIPIDDPDEDEDVAQPGLERNVESRSPSRAAWLGMRVLAVAFLAVGVLQAATWSQLTPGLGEASSSARGSNASGEALVARLGADALPAALGSWRAVDFQTITRAPDSDLGRCSLIWRYADARDEAALSFDFPFLGWNPSERGFASRGWEIESRASLASDESSEPTLEVRMRDASGRRGYLLLNQRTSAAHPLEPPSSTGWSPSAWLGSVRERLRNRFSEGDGQPATYQIQLLVTSDLPFDEAKRRQVQEAFRQSVARIWERVWPAEASP